MTTRVSSSSGRRIAPSFTLIELMMVLVVISILAGITISVSKYAAWRSARAQQEVAVEKIRAALDEYRSVNGEYPIIGDTKHYPRSFATECAYTGNSPWTNVNLATNTIENMSAMYQVDYSLTYPLMLGPLAKGRKPFLLFPNVAICALVYKSPGTPFPIVNADGSVEYYFPTHNVNRRKAIDPISQRQWRYVCSNGISYRLETNTFQ